VDNTPWPPDLYVEVISPDRRLQKAKRNLARSTANGCALGWLIDPEKRRSAFSDPMFLPSAWPPMGFWKGSRHGHGSTCRWPGSLDGSSLVCER
jgi:hypothetical protein